MVPLQAETNGPGVQGVAAFCIMGQTVGVFLAVKQEIKHKRRVSLEATSKKSLKSVFFHSQESKLHCNQIKLR